MRTRPRSACGLAGNEPPPFCLTFLCFCHSGPAAVVADVAGVAGASVAAAVAAGCLWWPPSRQTRVCALSCHTASDWMNNNKANKVSSLNVKSEGFNVHKFV